MCVVPVSIVSLDLHFCEALYDDLSIVSAVLHTSLLHFKLDHDMEDVPVHHGPGLKVVHCPPSR